jgi:transposase
MQHRHDMSDEVWDKIKEKLPGSDGHTGRPAVDNRKFIDAVMWILRTGSPWRDLPKEYGDWKNTHRRFCRWRDKCIWENILEVVSGDPDYQWMMLDSTYIECHQHSSGANGGPTARYIWPWMRLVCRSEPLLQMVPQMIAQRLSS